MDFNIQEEQQAIHPETIKRMEAANDEVLLNLKVSWNFSGGRVAPVGMCFLLKPRNSVR